MGKKLLAYGLPGLLIGGLIGWLIALGFNFQGDKKKIYSGGQPIIISDDFLEFSATDVAFSSWPNVANAAGDIVAIRPKGYVYNGIDVAVDGNLVSGCPAKPSPNTCEIDLAYVPGAGPIYVTYDAGASAGSQLTLYSDKTPFNQYFGYGENFSKMFHPRYADSAVTKVTVIVNGGPAHGGTTNSYTPSHAFSKCTVTIY